MHPVKFQQAFALMALVQAGAVSCQFSGTEVKTHERPNILWITCEDISPYLGSYGCKEALTPHLDQMAKEGIRFTHAYANAPVCAVARATILSGMYATTSGTHQMRSRMQLPEIIPAYPEILREAGYYCTNNSKKDYNSNFESDTTLWNESSGKAHYKNREPGQPFFAVFNLVVTHESQLAKERIAHYIANNQIPEKPRIDPAEIELPPYHPDLPEIREDWARLHDLITLMDKMTGDLLKELEDEGLADNTIVFFYSDHGGQLSRAKRYIYNVGTQVPFIIRLPEKWKHLSEIEPGGTNNELVSFVDFAKTALAITGCEVPDLMQGRVFMGKQTEKAPRYVHFYRDRMAERYDMSRAVTDGRYYFIRNFMPHRPLGRDSRYGFQVQANWRAWETHFENGLCNETESQFFQPKPAVHLFDTQTDPWHVTDLAGNPEYSEILKTLSEEANRWMVETRDMGLIPEPMFGELAGQDKKSGTMYEYAQSDEYPVKQVLDAANLASACDADQIQTIVEIARNSHPVIRYWGAYGLFRLQKNTAEVQSALKEMMNNDPYGTNRIMAAQALGRCGDPDAAFNALMKETSQATESNLFLFGLNAFQYSHTDNRLTLDDWKKLDGKTFPASDLAAPLGYHKRIIDDAIGLFPSRRVVD
jgi:N-sulfoglucosamine sulfohydrolase